MGVLSIVSSNVLALRLHSLIAPSLMSIPRSQPIVPKAAPNQPLLFFTIGLVSLAVILSTLGANGIDLGPAGLISRWSAVVVLALYVLQRKSLTAWIFFSMVFGVLLGHDFPEVGGHPIMDSLSQVFIHLIKAVIAPLVFATLVVGIAGHSDLKAVGRLGAKSFFYFITVTLVALVVGLIAINLTQAGVGVPQGDAAAAVPSTLAKAKSIGQVIVDIFPTNIAKSIAEGQVLQVVVFAVFFGIGTAMLPPDRKAPMVRFCEVLSDVMFKFTDVVMYFAPLGAGAAIAYAIGTKGLGILGNLAQLLGTLYGALFVFVLLVLIPIALVARIPLKRFFQAASGPVSLAFATASSEAALPKAMENMEKMGVPRKIVSFVLPTGYSFNLDGSTLYLSLASMFVAQAAGITLSWEAQVVMVLSLLLTSKGVAGVARASFVILASTVDSLGLPAWPLGLILGIDVLMDMGRTAVNVLGNCLASAVMARWEGEFDDAKAAEPVAVA